jgi:cytoskeleton protein RodZ
MKPHHPDNERDGNRELPLQALGKKLKESREQKGESLDDASKITRIGKNYLEALEEGVTSKLPNQAYTRGFIRLYAAHLGLAPDEISSMMDGRTADVPQSNPQEVRTPFPRHLSAVQQAAGSGRVGKFLIPLVCTAMLAVIVVTLFKQCDRKHPTTDIRSGTTIHPPAAVAPAASAPASTLSTSGTTPPAAAVVSNSSSEGSAEEGIVLRLKAVSAGRLNITIDGSISQEYDLVAGDMVEWKAEKMFLLDLENAGAVEAELDGKLLKPFGETGKAAHLIIRANGVQQD